MNKELRIKLLINLVNTIGQIQGVNVAPIIRKILEHAEVPQIDEVLGSLREESKRKQAEISRKQSEMKSAREMEDTRDISEDRPINEILQNLGSRRVLNPQAPQTVRNPFADLFSTLQR